MPSANQDIWNVIFQHPNLPQNLVTNTKQSILFKTETFLKNSYFIYFEGTFKFSKFGVFWLVKWKDVYFKKKLDSQIANN